MNKGAPFREKQKHAVQIIPSVSDVQAANADADIAELALQAHKREATAGTTTARFAEVHKW